jgi:hypothetical protein
MWHVYSPQYLDYTCGSKGVSSSSNAYGSIWYKSHPETDHFDWFFVVFCSFIPGNCRFIHTLLLYLEQGFSTGVPRNPRVRNMSLGVPWEIVIKKKNKLFFNLLAKINRSTEKYHSLLKRVFTIIIVLLYLQLTDHTNVPWAVDIIIFMQGFPETWKLFQGFLQGKNIEKGCSRIWLSTK